MMAEMPRQMLNDYALNLDTSGLKLPEVGASRVRGGYTVISNQWICKDEYLTCVRRIRQRLDITCHTGIEDNLACNRCLRGMPHSFVFRAILEHEFHFAERVTLRRVHVASLPEDKLLY
jgi:hypothetical protein